MLIPDHICTQLRSQRSKPYTLPRKAPEVPHWKTKVSFIKPNKILLPLSRPRRTHLESYRALWILSEWKTRAVTRIQESQGPDLGGPQAAARACWEKGPRPGRCDTYNNEYSRDGHSPRQSFRTGQANKCTPAPPAWALPITNAIGRTFNVCAIPVLLRLIKQLGAEFAKANSDEPSEVNTASGMKAEMYCSPSGGITE